LGPVLLDGTTGLADVLEIGSAEILVLLDIEPEVENVLCALSLEEKAVGREGSESNAVGKDKDNGLEHEEIDWRACSARQDLGEGREAVCAGGCPLVLVVHGVCGMTRGRR
jgi:hypothetical protein